MRLTDRNIDSRAAVHKKYFRISRDRVAPSATNLLLGSFVPGFAFTVLGVEDFCSAIGATSTYKARIGTTDLHTAGAPVAATRTVRTLGATIKGSATDTLNVIASTSARAAGTVTAGSNTGNGVAGAATAGSAVKTGTYTLICIAAASNAGTFAVFTPDGERLKDLTVAVAYVTNHLSLTIADGATDFIVGDTFTCAVTAGGSIDDLEVVVTFRATQGGAG